jgi:PleD family two-component response regulator
VIHCATTTKGSYHADLKANNIKEEKTPKRNMTVSTVGPKKAADPLEANVLVAEDNAINQKVVLAFLKKIGFRSVTLVQNGQLAVQTIKKNMLDSRFHVILMGKRLLFKACKIYAHTTRFFRLANATSGWHNGCCRNT